VAPLAACWADRDLTSPGLYRLRRADRAELDYTGQTGLHLRERLRMLRGVYRTEMPYRDPHTVAPALWALRQLGGEDYEASTSPVAGDARWRKALECVAIALYRQEHRRSPTFNFGRMPACRLPHVVSKQREDRGGRQAIPRRPNQRERRVSPALDLPRRVARCGRMRRHMVRPRVVMLDAAGVGQR